MAGHSAGGKESVPLLKRSRWCGELRAADAGREIVLNGWVQRRRDHGGLIFVDLRDRSGMIQVVFNPQILPGTFAQAEQLRGEFVVAVRGEVRRRLEGMDNPQLATGEIEVYVQDFQILNESKVPPFQIDRATDVDEGIRLKYRYIDLRRPEIQQALIFRHRLTKSVRDYLDSQGFLEIETPMLTRSTPEGARDYLVPSRVHPGAFFALPQSPQLFKQLLMVGGLERYFQIVRCFRDEDLRADRQPEFTQIDVEMSFVDEADVLTVMEGMIAHVVREVTGQEINLPLPRMSYAEAMDRFGTDRPDTRFGLELQDVSPVVAESGFQVFSGTVAKGGVVKGLNAKGCGTLPRNDLDGLVDRATSLGAKGLVWMVAQEDGIRSPVAKFLTDQDIAGLQAAMGAEPGDLLLFVADAPGTAAAVLGRLRLDLAERLGLIPEGRFDYLWVVDMPLFEQDAAGHGRLGPAHHPFTSPLDADLELLATDPAKTRAKAYDMVINGVEVASGSIRIHRREVQERIFAVLGLDDQEVQEKFGFLLDAFEYGTPPHGGIAFGMDRLVMLLAGLESIRDVIAFPKTHNAACLLTNAPAPVADEQLRDLNIRAAGPLPAHSE